MGTSSKILQYPLPQLMQPTDLSFTKGTPSKSKLACLNFTKTSLKRLAALIPKSRQGYPAFVLLAKTKQA
jgi:hypothetical protein